MKLKSLVFVGCFSLMASAFAMKQQHIHPNTAAPVKKLAEQKAMSPGECEIDIINNSNGMVNVVGVYDDNSVINFDVYPNEIHSISLYYNYYCHPSMYLTINSPYGNLYSGTTYVDDTLRILPVMNTKMKVQVAKR